MEIAFMALLLMGIIALSALVTPKNTCVYGGCYKFAGYEYEKRAYCYGHYLVRKYDPYLVYTFF